MYVRTYMFRNVFYRMFAPKVYIMVSEILRCVHPVVAVECNHEFARFAQQTSTIARASRAIDAQHMRPRMAATLRWLHKCWSLEMLPWACIGTCDQYMELARERIACVTWSSHVRTIAIRICRIVVNYYDVCTHIHMCINAYMHTDIHTCIHTCVYLYISISVYHSISVYI